MTQFPLPFAWRRAMFKAIAESRTSLLSLVTSAPVADPLPASQTSSPGSAFSSRARQGDAAQLTPQSTPPHTAPVRPQDHLHLHRRPLCRRRQPDAQDSPRARGVRPLPLPFLLSLSLSLSLQPLIRNPTRRQRRTVSRPQAPPASPRRPTCAPRPTTARASSSAVRPSSLPLFTTEPRV